MAREIENSDDGFRCCLCAKWFEGYGNNPAPLCDEDDFESRCCHDCNFRLVIPARLKGLRSQGWQLDLPSPATES